jgi:hypothetical protein
MEPTRQEIAAIHNQLKGVMASIVERAEDADEETEAALQLELSSSINGAVWEALYTLANHIDHLRATTVTGPWVDEGGRIPPKNHP